MLEVCVGPPALHDKGRLAYALAGWLLTDNQPAIVTVSYYAASLLL